MPKSETSLNELLYDIRRIVGHREKLTIRKIEAIYHSLEKDLNAFIANVYVTYADEEGRLYISYLDAKNRRARFLQEIVENVDSISVPLKNQIMSLVEETYTKSYEGMLKAFEKAYSETEFEYVSKDIAVNPNVLKQALNNNISKLTLPAVMEIHRNEIIYQIQQELNIGLMQGDRYERMAKRISERVGVSRSKAMNIVRTETHRNVESGFMDCAERLQKGLDGSDLIYAATWRAMKDERVRPQIRRKTKKGWKTSFSKSGANHMKMEGVTVKAGELFDLGNGVKAKAPSKSSVAAHDCNCRCFLEYNLMTAEEFAKATGKSAAGLTYGGEHDPIDYMSKFNPTFSDEKVLTTGNLSIRTKTVSNSKFKMFTDIDADRKNKAVRLTEKNLIAVQKSLPKDFEMPSIAVVDFNKHKLNAYAIGGYDKNTGIMYINSRYDTTEKVLAFVNSSRGRFANTTEYAPILHELGHKYYEDCIKRLAISENMSYNKAKKKIDKSIYKYIEDNGGDFFLETTLSTYAQVGYAKNSFTEITAECFSVRDENATAKDILSLLGVDLYDDKSH